MKIAFLTNDYDASKKAKAEMKKVLKEKHTFDQVNPDVVITIGGDGTVLTAVQKYKKILSKVKFMPIHGGTLGFMADFTTKEAVEAAKALNGSKKPRIEKKMLVEAINGKNTYIALNEIRLESSLVTSVIDVNINKKYLQTFRGNGIIVSTPTGSTAYNKSVGGAVVSAKVPCLQIAEIAGIQNKAYNTIGSPVIVSDKAVVELSTKQDIIVLGYDNKTVVLKGDQSVKIKNSKSTAQFMRYKNDTFTSRLRDGFII